MLSIKDILTHLNPEDIRCYTIWVKRTRSEQERLDIELVNHLNKNKLEESFIQKYYSKNRNAYYRLKNKVIEDIGKSLIIQYWNKDEWIKLINLLCIARLYYQKGLIQLSLHQFQKAEKLSEKLEDPQLADLVLSEIIRSGSYLNIDELNAYIEKRNQNRKLLFKLHQIDDITAVLENRIRSTQNLTDKDESIISWVNNYLNSLDDIKEEIKKSPTLRFKITRIVSKVLVQEKNFEELEIFLKENVHFLTSQNFFTQNNHNEYLELFIYLLNSLYYNKKYKECLSYSSTFLEELKKYDSLLYSKYIFYYYSNQINIYSAISPENAIKIIDEYEKKEKVNKETYEYFYILIQRMMLNYELNKTTNSLKTIYKIKVHPYYEKIDEQLQFKLLVGEVMLNFELQEFFKVKNVLKELEKKFSRFIKKKGVLYDIVFITKAYMNEKKDTITLKKKLEYLKNIDNNEESFINISKWSKRVLHTFM